MQAKIVEVNAARAMAIFQRDDGEIGWLEVLWSDLDTEDILY